MTGNKLLILIVGCSLILATAIAQELPHIIIIYADDVGYGDISCYNKNSAYTTPATG